MSKNKVEGLMKKHPPWFMFDFHPIRFVKQLPEEKQKNEKDVETYRTREWCRRY